MNVCITRKNELTVCKIVQGKNHMEKTCAVMFLKNITKDILQQFNNEIISQKIQLRNQKITTN